MIIFLIGIAFGLSLADENSLVNYNSSSARINIEWTKIEKLSISIPLVGEKNIVSLIDAPSPTQETTTASEWSTISQTEYFNCSDSADRDFIILLDAALMKEPEQILQLVGGFLDLIDPWNKINNRLALISYAYEANHLIKLSQELQKSDVLDIVRNITFEEGSYLHKALYIANYEILLPWREESNRERVVIILGAGFDNVPSWQNRTDVFCQVNGQMFPASEGWLDCMQEQVAVNSGLMTERFDAKILLVTVGQSQLPYYKYVVSEKETMHFERLENLSLQPVDRLAYDFCLQTCAEKEAIATGRGEPKTCGKPEVISIYGDCKKEENNGVRDFIILVDRAAMQHKNQTLNLIGGLSKLILACGNRLGLLSYAINYKWLIALQNHSTTETVLEAAATIEYEEGSNIANALQQSAISIRYTKSDFEYNWARMSARPRYLIIIAAGNTSTQSCEQFSYPPQWTTVARTDEKWLNCTQDEAAQRRALLTGAYGAKLMLVTIDDLPTRILKYVAPENEMVKINSSNTEDFALRPIDELQRRFCVGYCH